MPATTQGKQHALAALAERRAKSKGKRGYEIKDSSVSISLGLIKLGMLADGVAPVSVRVK